jgi:hypothetical protein
MSARLMINKLRKQVSEFAGLASGYWGGAEEK